MKKRFLSALLALGMALTLLPSVAVALPAITAYDEVELTSAIAEIDESGTITLGADIVLTNTLVIDGTKSFVIDLNGKKLSCSNRTVIRHSGTGTLTITDSSAGGGGAVETATFSVSTIQSLGNGKLIISGKATISSAYDTINIDSSSTPAAVVLEMTGGTVVSTATANSAIASASNGAVNVTGGTITGGNGIVSFNGNVNVSGGTVKGTFSSGCAISNYSGLITLSGGTFESNGSLRAIHCYSDLKLYIPSGSVIIKGSAGAMNVQPILTDYTSYQWRTSSTGPYTLSTAQAYSYSSSQNYVEFQPYTPPPATYTVAYHPGTNGTGSEVTDTKTQDVALTLRGAIFTRVGYTQTGWATTDGGAKDYELGGSYTANAAIDLYPVWTSGTVVNTEAALISAIANINEYDTIKLGANIALTNILVINGNKPFVIDLNGNTLSRNGQVIEYSGSGMLTITDSSDGGGKVETTTASASAIVSAGVGNLVISGKATISSAYEAITILSPVTPFITVLQINSGTVVSTATANSAIVNNSYGQIAVSGGTITGGNGIVSTSTGYVAVTGGTVTGTSGTAISCGATLLRISSGSMIINGTAGAMSVAPTLIGFTSYQWRTSSTGDYTLSTTQPYTYSAGHTYVEFKPYTPPATYTVAYHPGTNGTGSEVTDTKTQDVALTLRGALFTREGFTQTGWATTDGGAKAYELGGSYTDNTAIDLYPVWTSGILVNTAGGLAAAITNVAEGGTIKLTGDITLSGTYTISGKSFTIDLNGHTLTSDSMYGVITLSSCTLTIADSSVAKSGKITSSVAGNTNFGTINVNGGSLVVDSGTVENLYTANSSMHAIAVTAGNVTVNGGKVERNNESDNGFYDSIHNTGSGTILVTGGAVSGGLQAIYSTNGTVNVTGGEVSNDSINTIYNKGTLNVTGGTVECTNTLSSQAIFNDYGSVNIGGGGEVIGVRAINNYGSGTVTVTDGTITGSEVAIYSEDDGSISVSGGQLNGNSNAIYCTEMSTCDVSVTGGELYSTTHFAIRNNGFGDLSVAADARVEGKSTSYGAIYYNGYGEFTIGGSAVVTSPCSSATAGTIYMARGTLEITGGTVENTNTGATGNAIYAPASSVTIASASPVIIKGPGMAMTNAPAAFPTSYQWRTSSDGDYTLSTTQAYTYSAGHTYVEFKPYTPPATYTVAYHPGADGTGSGATDTKTQDVALTLRGAIFTREGYTQTGWASTDGSAKAYDLGGSYTNNAAIDLYPVWTRNPPAPGGGGSGTTSPAGYTVYNDPSIPNATIWLSGSGLSRNDLLVTQTITNGSNYNAMLMLADSGDILQVYDISLQSGRSLTGSAMYLTFDLTRQYAGQAFTLVHKKADGTFEYLYATAGADGKVKFGPVYELSPFMLAKGSLLQIPPYAVVDVPKTGDSASTLCLVLMLLAGLSGAGAVVYRKKRT